MRWVLILLVIFFGFLIIRSNLFTIKSVEVQSEKVRCVENVQIKNSSNLFGQNILFINSYKIENNLKKWFICIKNVETSRNFPDKVKLSVFGREPAAILVIERNEEATKSGVLEEFSNTESTSSTEASSSATFSFSVHASNESFITDNEGVIYSNSIDNINAPKIYIGGINLSLGQKIKGELISNVLKILEKINLFGININEAKIYSEKLLLINAKPKIIIRVDDNIDTQIASLQLILKKAKIDEENLEFIDLRFDKPVVRLAPKKKQ